MNSKMNSKMNDKMKKAGEDEVVGKITELVFILDRSGSMAGLEDDTIGGFNSMLAKQKKEAGEALVTTVLFDDKVELLHERMNIKEMDQLSAEEYYVRGSTALLDAIGKTINNIVRIQKKSSEDLRADKVLFVIITDGMENASREFSYDKIKNRIEHEKEKYGWEFIFLGANIDAASTAAGLGIASDRAANYNSDGGGTRLNYDSISSVVSEIRLSGTIKKEWKSQIDEDFKKRGLPKKS